MRRLGRVLLCALLGLAGVVLVAVLTLLLAGDWIYPRVLATVARSGAGLALTTRGPVTVQWWPAPGVTAADLRVTPLEAPVWDVQLQQIRVEIERHSLLRGKLVLERVVIGGARVRGRPSGLAEPLESGSLGILTRANIRVDDALVEIQGVAGRGSHTIQIDRYASGPGPDGRPHVEARGSVDGSALSVDGRFSAVAERSGDAMAFPLTASVSIPGWALTGTVQGHVTQPLQGRGLALTTSLEIGDVTTLVDLLGLPGPLAGSVTLHATVDGDLPSPRLASIEATLAEKGGLSARIEGTGISPSGGVIDSLQVSIDGPWPGGGPSPGGSAPEVSGTVRVKGAPGRYQVEVDRAQLIIGDRTQLEASGTLELQALDDWRAARGQLELKASTVDVAALSTLAGIALPDLGPASLRGRLSGPLTGATLADAELEVGTKGKGVLHLMAKGKAGPLQLGSEARGMAAVTTDLRIQISTPSVAALSHLVGDKLPDLGPARLHGRLTGPLASATLEDAELEVGKKGRGALHLTAKGKTGPLQLGAGARVMATAETDVRLELRVDDVKALAADLPAGLKTLKPWAVRTHLRTSPRRWRVSDLVVSAGSRNAAAVNVSGNMAGRGDLASGLKRMLAGAAKKGDAADLNVALETANARATAALMGINIPELGALKGSARIVAQEARGLSVRGLSVQSLGALAMRLAGDIGELHGLRDVTLDLTLAETRPEVIDRLLDLELPLARNVSLQGTLRRPGQEVLAIGGEARVGSSRFALELTAERTATVPLVKGRIHSARMHAKDFWDEEGSASRAKSSSTPPAEGLGLLDIVPGLDFVLQDSIEQQQAAEKDGKADELPWHRLKQVEIELDVHVDTVQGVHVRGGPLELRLVDKAGRLEFGPFKLAYQGGALTIDGVADSNASPPSLEIKGRGEKLPMQELAAYGQLRSAGLAGELNVDYHLHSRGLGLPQLRAGLGGEIRTMLEHGRAPVGRLDLLSADLLDWVGTLVASDASTAVPCALVDLQIKGGVADARTFYVKTDRAAVYGIGKVDLRDDTVDLTVMPKASGPSLSAPTTVRIHGPLASPALKVVNPSEVALHYGIELAEDVEFPPVILLRKLFSRGASKAPGPCH